MSEREDEKRERAANKKADRKCPPKSYKSFNTAIFGDSFILIIPNSKGNS